jgi:hypothetical protein
VELCCLGGIGGVVSWRGAVSGGLWGLFGPWGPGGLPVSGGSWGSGGFRVSGGVRGCPGVLAGGEGVGDGSAVVSMMVVHQRVLGWREAARMMSRVSS